VTEPAPEPAADPAAPPETEPEPDMASDIDAAAQDLTKEALDTDGVMMTRPSNMSSESAQPDNSVKRIIELINR
jgi:hypothetical protein